VRGKEAHSSLTPLSVNAIEEAAKLITHIRGMADDMKANETRYEGFDVPFSTASVGQFQGGIADNVVPRDAWFHYEFRDLPTADVVSMQKQVLAQSNIAQAAMRKIAPEAGFSFETICAVPSFLGSAKDAITQLAQRLSGESTTTEAGVFKNAGISTVVCGPGSINQAHQPDEFVSLAQLARCEQFMQKLAATTSIAA
jgi:acetylornithine deacetylase